MKIIGIDEVGYGAWAGPLMNCAVYLDIQNFESQNEADIIAKSNEYINSILPVDTVKWIRDSKKLSIQKREEMYNILTKKFLFAIGVSQPEEIDAQNVRNANFAAMERAVNDLHKNYDLIIIDGNAKPSFSTKIVTMVDGDEFSKLISIASIIAKVTRDHIMHNLHNEFPNYGWDKNVGYGTKLHTDAIKTFGITKYHRKSYKPIKKILEG